MDYPILCICRKRKPLVLENPFLDDKRIIQPQWESGSEEFLVEALSELDIEGLLLNCVDPPSGFIDHDNLRCPGGAPIIIQNRFSVSQPHSSKKNYYCTWCQYRKTSKTCNKHDASRWCHYWDCKGCRYKHTRNLKAELARRSQILQLKGEDNSDALTNPRCHKSGGHTPRWEIEKKC
ncbi:hypothetical protein BGZ60DRAFT_160950 [Tricladium varicosporioides]|nr:hypothetical protein BGZ60DRAFT_160950 [Hymenoscyphus varicosporioides]